MGKWGTDGISLKIRAVDRRGIEWRLLLNSYRLVFSGCQEWMGAKSKDGYGVFKVNGKAQYVHRVAFALHCGEIPAGMEIHHRCNNRACINPEHLEMLTDFEHKERERVESLDAETPCPDNGIPF